MEIEIKKYLYDIQNSIDSIFEYLGEKRDFSIFMGNKLLRRGIERELGIIGEAVTKILKIEPSIKIDNAKKIVALRNMVIHSYDKIDESIIWGIVIKDLPVLKSQVEDLLQK